MKTNRLYLALLAGGVMASSGTALADQLSDDVKSYQGALDTAILCKEKYQPYWTDLKEDRKGPPENTKAFYDTCVSPLEKAFADFVQSVPHKTVREIEQALGERYMGRYLLAQVGTAHAVAGQTNVETRLLPGKTKGDLLMSLRAHEERDLLLRINKDYSMEQAPTLSAEGADAQQQKRLAELQIPPNELYTKLNKVVDDGLYTSIGGTNADSYEMMEGAVRGIKHRTPEMLKSRADLNHNAYPLKLQQGPTPAAIVFFEIESEQVNDEGKPDKKQNRKVVTIPPMVMQADLVDTLKKQKKVLAINCGVSQSFIYVPENLHKTLKNGYVFNDPKRSTIINIAGKPEDKYDNRPIILKPKKMDDKNVDTFDWLTYVTISANDSTSENQLRLQKGRILQTFYHIASTRWSDRDKKNEINYFDGTEGYQPHSCFPRAVYSDIADKNLIMYYGIPLGK